MLFSLSLINSTTVHISKVGLDFQIIPKATHVQTLLGADVLLASAVMQYDMKYIDNISSNSSTVSKLHNCYVACDHQKVPTLHAPSEKINAATSDLRSLLADISPVHLTGMFLHLRQISPCQLLFPLCEFPCKSV